MQLATSVRPKRPRSAHSIRSTSAPSPSPSTTASIDHSRIARSGAAETCGPPKTIGASQRRFTARATSTAQRCVTLYDVKATTSGRVATTRVGGFLRVADRAGARGAGVGAASGRERPRLVHQRRLVARLAHPRRERLDAEVLEAAGDEGDAHYAASAGARAVDSRRTRLPNDISMRDS